MPETQKTGAIEQATIMMVDDEPIIVETLENLLGDAGYKNFVSTTNPKEAIDLMQSKKPDIVLLDLMMPEVTGLDLLETMGMDAELQFLPSIIITAATDSETKLKALELGATDVLNKPVDPSELALRVRNTLATKANQDRLMKFDALTGLPNRRLFMAQLARALTRAKENSTGFALLHIDLDNFKKINDTLGNSAGDGLLKGVAKRLEGWLRDTDLAAITGVELEDIALSRIGGDEFILILHDVARMENAEKIASDVISKLDKPYRVSGREIFVTASVGVAGYPVDEYATPETADGEIMDMLLSNADIAMSEAKRLGKNRPQQYTKELSAKSLERLNFELQLRQAMERHELSLRFRPKASVWTDQLTGAEALLCWNSQELGEVPREQFIPIAEEAGLIVPFCEWTIYEACKLASQWQSSSTAPVRITVGVSSRQVDLSRLMLAIRTALNGAGISGECLGAEFTESIFVDSPEENMTALQGIKDMGVEISIGHFGTGHSSLSYLRSFPVDQLKIDRSFLNEIPNNTDNAAIVASFIPMTHSLGMTVVADGVENTEQLSFLKDRGCDEYQGKHLSTPLEAPDFLSKLQGNPQ
ncbi:MAG: EAL domain-containing protein [Proteobacteria bacterium]|nr:EAL domain-containing protein [Pseudomonadota bacterium]